MGLLAISACGHLLPSSAIERGEVLAREGRAVEAYEAFAEAVCENPRDVRVATEFVEIWHQLGGVGDPAAKVSRCKVSEPVVLYIEGMRAAVAGRSRDADIALARALELSPPAYHAEIEYRRGLVALNAGNVDALSYLERAAGLAPARVDVRLAMARVLVDGEEYAEAVAVLRGVLALDVTPEEINKARRILGTAIDGAEPKLNPGVERTLQDILVGLEKGTPETTALVRAQALVEEVPHPRVLKVAALVALHRGLETEAVNRLEVAAELSPLDPEPWRILGMARHAGERANEAAAALGEAHRRDPFDVDVARVLASTSTQTQDFQTARDTYVDLTRLEPAVAEHYLLLARSERRLGRATAARRAAEAGVAISGQSVPLLLELASIEAQLALGAPTEDERRAARRRTEETIERLLEVAPDHPGAAAILASLEEHS